MREVGRRVQHDCTTDGTYLDLMNLIKVCEAEVFEMQKPTSNAPQLVILAGAVGLDNGSFVSDDGFPLTSMSDTCGMELLAPGNAAVGDFFNGLVKPSNISMFGIEEPPSNRSSSPSYILAPSAWCYLTWDERGIEICWLMLVPIYGQADSGAIWNRTVNEFATTEPPSGCGFGRCPQEPCVYSKAPDGGESRVTMPLYVDDGRLYWDPTPEASKAVTADKLRLKNRFGIEFGEDDPTLITS